MAFDPIDTAEIQVKKPVTRSLLQKIKDSLDFLNGRIGTLELQGLQNGSFEIDSDADGVPDNWTRTLYPGGLAAINTTPPAHGASSFKFTHPGGSGNGGGTLTSDYIPVSSCHVYMLDFIHWVSANLRCLVEVKYYDNAKVYYDSAVIYDQTAATPTDPTYFIAVFTPPAGAWFMKIVITGGHSSVSTAGAAWFDGIRLNPSTWNIGHSMPFTIAEGSTSSLSWADVSTTTVIIPVLSSPAILTFVADLKTDNPGVVPVHLRFKIGAAYSDEFEVNTDWASHTFSLPFQSGSAGSVDVVMQCFCDDASGSAYGRKPSAAATLRFNL